ncbi:MAG: radical SAM protein [Candidatus Bathyarchaeia archaeon]
MREKLKKITKPIRIALVNPPPLRGVYHHQLYLPLGLAYLAAVLEEAGYEVKVVDCPAIGITHEKLEAELSSFEPFIVGITSMTPTINSAFLSAKIAKKACPEAMVVLGGPHVTFMDKEVLAQEMAVDVVVRGEGEKTFLEIAQKSCSQKPLHKIDGITFRYNGEIVRNPDREYIQNLDELPRPAYKYFPLDKYRLFGRKILPVITSRGCPFQCAFCVTSRVFGKAFRARNPKSVVDELEWLKDVYGADAFSFYDDTITFDRKRILEICEEICNRKIGLPWDCQTRVDRVSKEILVQMKRAGCQQVFFGIESGSQKILEAVKKGTTVEQNERAIKWAKEVGLFVAVSVIVGYPGETTETLKQTINFLKKTKPDDVYICIATPYPGTELRNLIEKMGWKMSTEWQLYDTTTLVFEDPMLSAEDINKLRQNFYDSFYSPTYILRHFVKRNFYSQIMARTALNHILWRLKSIF